MDRPVRTRRYVKDSKHIADASAAAVRAMWPQESQHMLAELVDNGFEWPSRGTIQRSRPRLD
eukprot:3110157-Pyramimonas_sp.AAC.1